MVNGCKHGIVAIDYSPLATIEKRNHNFLDYVINIIVRRGDGHCEGIIRYTSIRILSSAYVVLSGVNIHEDGSPRAIELNLPSIDDRPVDSVQQTDQSLWTRAKGRFVCPVTDNDSPRTSSLKRLPSSLIRARVPPISILIREPSPD